MHPGSRHQGSLSLYHLGPVESVLCGEQGEMLRGGRGPLLPIIHVLSELPAGVVPSLALGDTLAARPALLPLAELLPQLVGLLDGAVPVQQGRVYLPAEQLGTNHKAVL